ncbi:CRISPR-associated endoribonuclease Cas6 [Coleofasciculus sp. F4-SAH-05]|uniref:CRISPR-associated endoribonuclease Cas6 n=1 Tax=Coleofasciculus sp. F4-SAH-05 TaxID=3069525 RepID=UPI0032F10426
MPHSLILNLLPQSPIPTQFLSGRHLHALFLNLVSSVDRNLGDYLHEAKADKAFTLSPLQLQHRGDTASPILQWQHHKPIPQGTPCWWRISLLDDTLFSQLTHLWLNLNPEQPWHLGPANLQITSILGTKQKGIPGCWANALSYSQLYDQASACDRALNFAFSTPTAFRQSKYDCSLPTRELVFNSLIKRWNQYSGIEFPKPLVDHVFPSFFDIHTELVADSRSKFIGCVGAMNFRIMGQLEAQMIQQINALADFALYSGVGRKTTMGMGIVRRIKS